MQPMKSGRAVVNPFAEPAEVATASASASTEKELAVASALTNENPSQCPKCGDVMGKAFIATGDSVFYCVPCRVTNPIPA